MWNPLEIIIAASFLALFMYVFNLLLLFSKVYWKYYSTAERFKRPHVVFWNSSQLQAEPPLVRQTAKVQQLQHFLSVRICFSDLLIQGWDLRNSIVSPFSLLLLQCDGNSSHETVWIRCIRCETQPKVLLQSILLKWWRSSHTWACWCVSCCSGLCSTSQWWPTHLPNGCEHSPCQ